MIPPPTIYNASMRLDWWHNQYLVVLFDFVSDSESFKLRVDPPVNVRCVAAKSGKWPSLAITRDTESQRLRSPVTLWRETTNERPAWDCTNQ